MCAVCDVVFRYFVLSVKCCTGVRKVDDVCVSMMCVNQCPFLVLVGCSSARWEKEYSLTALDQRGVYHLELCIPR